MPPGIQAVIFDLYGTLLHTGTRLLHREVPRLLGVDRRRWVRLVRQHLLTRAFPDRAAFARFICEALAPGRPTDLESVLALLERELASVELSGGALSLLAFLRRRGYALGVLSNLSSVHKEPVSRLGLQKLFSATGYSCDEGLQKPEPRIYLDLCARLGVQPEAALVVGDSARNDVEVPRRLGMRALRVGETANGAGLSRVADLAWVCLSEGVGLTRLLADGDSVLLGGASGVLRGLRTLPDAEQGRYNLIAAATVELPETGASVDVFCKRLLLPEAAYVEQFAHRLYTTVGLPSCDTGITGGPEPCLIVSKAPGSRLAGPVTPPLAFEIGRHGAAAYLFANADLRPRNAFVSYEHGRPSITMIDLEYCFFNLAFDVSGLADPLRPEALDRLPETERMQRLQRRVLTERTTRRARRSFFETEGYESELARVFREGWRAAYRRVQAEADMVCGLIEERIYREPFLIIGTRAHRRAMARVDLEDIRRRMGEDPDAALARHF